MIRTRLIGIFAGSVLASAIAACGSSGDDTATPTGGTGGTAGHVGGGGAGGNSGSGTSGGKGGTSANGGSAGSLGLAGEAGAGEAGAASTTAFKVRIENVSGTSALPTGIAPGVYVASSAADPFFAKNSADRGLGLAALASDANPASLLANLRGAAGVGDVGVFDTPVAAKAKAALQPGDAYEFTVAARSGDTLNIATMFGESNDAFFAPSGAGIALFDAKGQALASHDVTAQLSLWDAGVEKDEAPGLGPSQAPRQVKAGDGSPEGVASKRIDTTRALPLAQGIVHFTVTATASKFTIVAKNVSRESGALVTPISPFYMATHSDAFTLFSPGSVAPVGLESLAEDGNPAAHVSSTSALAGVGTALTQGTAPLMPGETVSFDVLPLVSSARLSLATMIGQTNDVFIATPPAGIALLDKDGVPRPAADVEEELNRTIADWDAGTEANQVPGAGNAIKTLQAGNNFGAADDNNKVRRYSDSANDLAGAKLGGFVDVSVKAGAAGAFDVLVKNTSAGNFVGVLSPVAWAVHDDQTALFSVGKAVSPGLESLAEDGDAAKLVTELSANSHVLKGAVQGSDPIESGAAFAFSVTPDKAHRFLSIASMVVPSNDTFLALGESGVALLDATGAARSDADIAADVTLLLAAYDAGTEANQAGAAGPSMAGKTMGTVLLQAAPNTGVADGNGLVRLLASSVWTYPSVASVIKVTVSPQ